MSLKSIEQTFIEKVSGQIQLFPEGKERFRVFTPFMFEDGDELVIVLKKEGGRWILSDEAHTYMHLTYEIDEKLLHSGPRKKLILKALSMFDVEDRSGELILEVPNGDYGEALYDFAQALLKITDVSYLSKERVQSTFMEDFRDVLLETVPAPLRRFDWHDSDRDPDRKYRVDCRIKGKSQPLFVYALSNDNRIRDATISLHQFKEWNIPFRSMGIFKDPKKTSRKVRERFSDVCDKEFHSLTLNYANIQEYLVANIGNLEEPKTGRK